MKATVKKSAYKGLPQFQLASFAKNVIASMTAGTEYQSYAGKVQVLQEQTAVFEDALSRAFHGGADRIAQKDLAKANVLKTLDLIAKELNYQESEDPTWILNAGFEPSKDASRRLGDLQPPTNLKAAPQVISGEVVLTYSVPEPKRVRTNGLEYSLDAGATWNNGTYSTSSVIRIKGLPSRQAVQFRLCSIGSYQRKSSWSEVMEMFLI